jgi:trehalose 6-phosphate phosphatase
MQEKHPSALDEFESLAAAASGKQIVMFLDYDGTLSPIVADPDSAVMTDEVRDMQKQSFLCSFLSSQLESCA